MPHAQDPDPTPCRGQGKRASLLCAVVLFLAALVATAAPVLAQTCTPPAELRALRAALLPAGQGGSLDPPDQDRLARSLSALNERRLVDELRDADLEALAPVALSLAAQARRIAESGRTARPAALRADLAEYDRIAALPCGQGTWSVGQMFQTARAGKGSAEDGATDVPPELTRNENVRPAWLLGALAFLILALYALDLGYRWVMALIYNRKSCRIPAQLMCGETEIPGRIVTLGRGGCRFQPDDMQVFDEEIATLRQGETRIVCAEQTLDLQLGTIHDSCADFRFATTIPLAQQRDLLKCSFVSPQYAKRARRRPSAAPEP